MSCASSVTAAPACRATFRDAIVRSGIAPWLILGGLALVLDVAFARVNLAETKHDLAFHASNVHDFLQAWREGVIYPRWSATCNHGLGSPTFVFYPPLAYALAALLGLLGCDVPTSLRFTFSLLALARGAAMFVWLRARQDTRRWALPAAVAYMLLPYPILNVFRRAALAEVAALAWLPLILWGCDALRQRGPSRLALAWAGLLFTHLLSMLMFGPVVVGYLAWNFGLNRRIWLRWFAAAMLGSCLAAVFVLPAVTELRHTAVPAEHEHDGSFLGVYWRGSFLFDLGANDREWQLFNWTVSSVTAAQLCCAWLAAAILLGQENEPRWRRRVRRTLYAAAIFLLPLTIPLGECLPDSVETTLTSIWSSLAIGALVVASGVLLLLATIDRRDEERSLVHFAMLALAAAALMMTPVSTWIWSSIPKLASIQFPWRWNGLASVAAAVLVAAAGSKFVSQMHASSDSGTRSAAGYPAFALIATLSVALMQSAWFASGSSTVMCVLEDYSTVLNHGRTNIDYIPAAGFRYFVTEQPRFTDRAWLSSSTGQVTIETWQSHQRQLSISTPVDDELVIRTFWFPGWTATLDGAPLLADAIPNTGLMRLKIPAGQHQLELRFENSWPRTAGAGISVMALAILLVRLPRNLGRGLAILRQR